MPIDPLVHPWFDPQSLAGSTLHGHQLGEMLGHGGFGAVYKTRSSQGDDRAIKVLYPQISASHDDVLAWTSRFNHFQREVLAARGFNHPNIIKVYDLGQEVWQFPAAAETTAPRPVTLAFYVADYVPDGVDRRLKGGRLFSPEEAVRIIAQVCDALTVLHTATQSILHLDLNPGNVRLTVAGDPVLTDFGVARIDGLPRSYVTGKNVWVHPGVGAPEQLEFNEPDVRTDIYQCGALLLMMLTGKYPRQGEPPELLAQRRTPQGLSTAVLRCLRSDSAERFQSAAALREALPGVPSRPPVAPRPPPKKDPAPLWQARVEQAYWTSEAAPVAVGDVLVHWERQSVRRLSAERGDVSWSWRPLGLLADGYRCPPVQVRGERIYVRHGEYLSRLDARGMELDRRRLGEGASGVFLVAEGAIVTGSVAAGRRADRGLAALDESGNTLWSLPAEGRRVDRLAECDGGFLAVESAGIASAGGLMVRRIGLPGGEELAAMHLSASEGPARKGQAALVRVCRPLVAQGGAVVLGLQDLSTPRLHLVCADANLNVLWRRVLDGGA